MLATLLAMTLAAASAEPLEQSGSRETSLGVTATVVRPIAIDSPSILAGGVALTIRNTAGVEVLAPGATIDQPEPGMTTVTGDRTGPIEITIVH